MRSLLIIASVAGFCTAGRLGNNYLPPNSAAPQRSLSGPSFGHTQPGQGANFGPFSGGASFQNVASAGAYQSGGYGGASARQQSSHEAGAQILRSNSDVNEHGYAYDFETSNGIRADQSASAVNGVQAQGSFAYKGDDGHDYSISYTADENGYQPRGDHLPTSPPIPEAILRSLEQNAREEANGGSSDGSYRSDSSSYGGGAGQYSSGAQQGASFQHQGPSSAASRQYLAPHQQSYSGRSGYNY